jgi:hypothetical protein
MEFILLAIAFIFMIGLSVELVQVPVVGPVLTLIGIGLTLHIFNIL